jgi:hypothetical protein
MTGDNKKAVEAAARLEQVVTNPQDKAAAAVMQGAALYREAAQHKKKALLSRQMRNSSTRFNSSPMQRTRCFSMVWPPAI